MNGVELIAAERLRQERGEGWTPAHDDTHDRGEMARAAAIYATPPECREIGSEMGHQTPVGYPWNEGWWKPGDRVRELTKAGALIAAEIDRLQRLTPGGAD